ncbi:MAG: glycoside hydrolase family 9 protein [Verrucomicrobiota bacterium]
MWRPPYLGCNGRVIFSRVRLACRRAVAPTAIVFIACLGGAAKPATTPLALPTAGERSMLLLSPTMLEIAVITPGEEKAPAHNSTPEFPAPAFSSSDFTVMVAGKKQAVSSVGFRRRPVYAPLKKRDLRIGNYIYLRLTEPTPEGASVEVSYRNDSADKIPWLAEAKLTATADPLRLSPVVHVNQVGYLPETSKVASIGYYLGTLGELELGPGTTPDYQVIEAATGKVVHKGALRPRADKFMPNGWYKRVWEADFSEFKTPGEYRVGVPGLGASYPFFIDAGIAGAFARTYALGLYHQRCGCDNSLPYSRFVHAACHTAPADIPSGSVRSLKGFEGNAPNADLFPFVRRGKVDVSGGHHDAGDYSKYTINSANFVHSLIFAVDVFEGVASVDNLGLPESGDGISDLLQIAKWESDFLAKMQDEDGGFYFLVYPRDRRYEDNVLPDKGDPQIVWPKNSVSTAAAVAALAQCSSSPAFKKQYPQEAAKYLEAATKGWQFLLQAQLKQKGKPEGIYRRFSHYGDLFQDNDEIAWAAVEMYLATGDKAAEDEIRLHLQPHNANTRRWSWWRMTESYGRAIRSYAFAPRTHRIAADKLDPQLIRRCEHEIITCAEDWARASRDGSYGVTFPEQTKRAVGGGWFFPMDYAYDLAVACQLDYPEKADRRPVFRDAIVANINYEAGSNPVNVSFLTGLGWKRPLDIVHQYAQNDQRALPVSGIPLGSIQQGFHYMDNYRKELGALTYPLDGAKVAPYPLLDRWGDSFNLQTEFVAVNQARGLAVTAWLFAQTPVRSQTWKPVAAKIEGVPSAKVAAGKPLTLRFISPSADLDPALARIVWDGRDQAPAFGTEFVFTPQKAGAQWIEAEAQWPDGRRVVAVAQFDAGEGSGTVTSAQR